METGKLVLSCIQIKIDEFQDIVVRSTAICSAYGVTTSGYKKSTD